MNPRRLVTYLAGLKAHNRKPWFDAHRAEYDALRAEFEEVVEEAILRIARFEPEVAAVSPRECIFRIYRDVRFSKDKTPYKTQFSAAIGPGGRKGGSAGYYFHVDAAGLLLVAGGIYMPDARQLARIRQAIADDPRGFRVVVSAPRFRRRFGGLYDEDRLQRPPRGFAADHPAVEWLKLKRFVAWSEKPVSRLRGKGLAAYVADECRALQPLVAWLRAALD
ncbi:MAG TPA: DUF2461 domain-containing protein [Candidatus Eisenbacteria bacterium]